MLHVAHAPLPVTCAYCAIECAMRVPTVPPAQQALLQSGMMRRRRLDPGSELYGQGENAGEFMILASGWACLYKILPDGGRQILKFALPGDLIGFSVNRARECDHSAVALTEMIVCSGSRALIHQAMSDPVLIARIADALIAEQVAIRDQLISIARRSALQRVAHLLIDLFTRTQGQPPRAGEEMDLPLTQEQIGDALGLTGIHVNRMLSQLRRIGAVAVRRRKLRVLNAERLLAAAETAPLAAPRGRRPEHRLVVAAAA